MKKCSFLYLTFNTHKYLKNVLFNVELNKLKITILVKIKRKVVTFSIEVFDSYILYFDT